MENGVVYHCFTHITLYYVCTHNHWFFSWQVQDEGDFSQRREGLHRSTRKTRIWRGVMEAEYCEQLFPTATVAANMATLSDPICDLQKGFGMLDRDWSVKVESKCHPHGLSIFTSRVRHVLQFHIPMRPRSGWRSKDFVHQDSWWWWAWAWHIFRCWALGPQDRGQQCGSLFSFRVSCTETEREREVKTGKEWNVIPTGNERNPEESEDQTACRGCSHSREEQNSSCAPRKELMMLLHAVAIWVQTHLPRAVLTIQVRIVDDDAVGILAFRSAEEKAICHCQNNNSEVTVSRLMNEGRWYQMVSDDIRWYQMVSLCFLKYACEKVQVAEDFAGEKAPCTVILCSLC